MAYNFSFPHITSLLFDAHSLSLSLMHFDSSLSTLLFPFSHSRDLRLFLVVSWLCSSDTWVWFCGCAPAGCGSDFVGFCWLWYEFELCGGQIRAWGLARWCHCRFGRGSWVNVLRWFRSVHRSDWFMVRGFFFFLPWIVADLVVGRGWFGSWVFFGCGLWFMCFFCLAVVGGCRLRSGERGRLLGYGYCGMWLWLVGQWWRWFRWSKMTQTKRQHRWSFDQSRIQTKPRFKLKKLWRFRHGSLLNFLGFFFVFISQENL